MPRYVLLRHDCPADYRDGPHWDLMLEQHGALRTWSLLELPAAWSGDGQGEAVVAAHRLPDHRLDYLEYEGEVSGGRGRVDRRASGEFRLTSGDDGRVEVLATTGELAGRWTLSPTEGDHWRLTATGR